MKTITTIPHLPIVAALWLVVPAALAVETNCTDPVAVAGWRTLLQRYPDDYDLRELYQLREQLCADLKRGTISVDDASERFERTRSRLLHKWEQHNERLEQATVEAG